MEEDLTFGQKISDKLAEFAGSWTFIISFFVLLSFWMWLNVNSYFPEDFDPYPFILLNLCLSCLAAIQAPVILMSQNRQGERDRAVLQADYEVDKLSNERLEQLLKDVRALSFKLDKLQKENTIQQKPSPKPKKTKKS